MTKQQQSLLQPVLSYLSAREGLGLQLTAIASGVRHEGHEAHDDDVLVCLDYYVARALVSVMPTSTGVNRYAVTPAGVLAHDTNS